MKTIFVSGGTGFIGRAFVREAVAQKYAVSVLCRSEKSEAKVRALGATPVPGDLLTKGAWQESAKSSAYVVHLAQPQTFGGRVTKKRAESYREDRLTMDRNLLDPLDAKHTERIVYVAGTSYYGNLGLELHDEDTEPKPRGWGPYVAPAIERLRDDLARGLPIVTAFPGYVYGDGSWFREYVIVPLRKDKKLSAIGGRSRMGSPIHVDDCARAILHLLEHGEVGRRYFVVDDRPVPWKTLYETAARAVGREPRLRTVPAWLLRLLVGPIVADSVLSDGVLSNTRLKALGFSLRFPSIDEGIPHVIKNARPSRS